MGNEFYLGRVLDPSTEKVTDQDFMYDPDDLTTHAIITGMTGSGKTGLGVGMLEEAALQNIPAFILDPKGDLTNLLLHFPELLGEDFTPWVDPQTAQQKNITIEELGAETAETWKKGLAGWGLGKEQIEALRDSADFTIYTPGSNAGIPINVISSFEAPNLDWENNAEVLRERIASTVTALLGLVGMHDIDPLRSREHILLSNLLENAWREDRSLTMLDLITQIQEPPFDRLGAFPLDTFFPDKDRMELAFLINNFLASPSFQSWGEGQPLDFRDFIRTADGRPKHSVFYIAHLNEDERMFFVTLFFAALESWMRTQRGTGHLRAMVYFDEVMGYLPPVSNPPSRTLILRMLKQARAYGVGLVLATQNPVDVDYKALSNAGTWLIGRLQTERDIDRLMDGLRAAGSTLSPAEIRNEISGLPKRCFFIHNVHGGKPTIFNTRWVMNYLAGPMTRTQIPALNKLVGVENNHKKKQTEIPPHSNQEETPMPVSSTAPTQVGIPVVEESRKQSSPPYSSQPLGRSPETKPVIPSNLHEVYLPVIDTPYDAMNKVELQLANGVTQKDVIHYIPQFFMQYSITFTSRTYNIYHTIKKSYLVDEVPHSAFIDWERFECQQIDPMRASMPERGPVTYGELPDRMLPDGSLSSFKSSMIDWLYRNASVPVKVNAELKVYGAPDESEADFFARCREVAKEEMEAEADKLRAKHDKATATLMDKIERAEHDVDEQRIEVQQRQMETLGSAGELALSLISKRRRSVSRTLSKTRLSRQAKEDLKQEELELRQLEQQLEKAEEQFKQQLDDLEEKWTKIAHEMQEEPIQPYKKDVINEVFGVAWMPCYVVEAQGNERIIPAWHVAVEE